jgi:hypothetical protein
MNYQRSCPGLIAQQLPVIDPGNFQLKPEVQVKIPSWEQFDSRLKYY